ncbi:hypothetical protein HZH66_003059 [Vespula vulgaris]|uniref:Uncharacterized protein n=2 Tax=Vespula TaxID=7451 RepID=A0A834PC35_VESPE|nr:hypothetical protein HZH66_003059 [Vespula vulgaris]KAF7435574.1 hypothetical protein H0235_003765 [Vespula pensylvanica]
MFKNKRYKLPITSSSYIKNSTQSTITSMFTLKGILVADMSVTFERSRSLEERQAVVLLLVHKTQELDAFVPSLSTGFKAAKPCGKRDEKEWKRNNTISMK